MDPLATGEALDPFQKDVFILHNRTKERNYFEIQLSRY